MVAALSTGHRSGKGKLLRLPASFGRYIFATMVPAQIHNYGPRVCGIGWVGHVVCNSQANHTTRRHKLTSQAPHMTWTAPRFCQALHLCTWPIAFRELSRAFPANASVVVDGAGSEADSTGSEWACDGPAVSTSLYRNLSRRRRTLSVSLPRKSHRHIAAVS